MERIIEFLLRVKDNYGVYIGNKSLSALNMVILGYQYALYDLTGELSPFNREFQRFVEDISGERGDGSVHWHRLLLDGSSEQDAFDRFFELLSEFCVNI